MPDRLLRESIRTDQRLNRLSALEESLYFRLLVSCDEEGCFNAWPIVVNKTCFPLKDYRDSQIKIALRNLTSAGMITLEQRDDGEYFLRLQNWDGYKLSRHNTVRDKDETGDKDDETAEKKPAPKAASKPRERLTQRQQALFDRFWAAYPRKIGKGAAEARFKSINPDEALVEVMIDAVEAQKHSAEWQRERGAYIPHPSTWLNQRRWEDEVEAAEETTIATPSLKDRGLEDWDA